ncbi:MULTISPECIES: lipase family protein [unclassified Pseudomonas]|uniref:lipase family protein n=1 Tax=unclassified Pseudomonas TaxID=196821 RepID=UPI0030D9E03E
MNDTLHRTDTLNPRKDVIGGKQKQHWVEFQLLDEQGDPLANMPYRAVNDATRAACAPECAGQSDAQGVIRIDGLHPIPITLLMTADPLAEQLQTRRLRAQRSEPPRPVIGDRSPLYGPQRSGFSPIEKQALAAGHVYHYLRIGQLCDQLPTFDPPVIDPKRPPAFHFPDQTYSGFTVDYEALNRRHVLEVCPLRAWSLVLHHQPEYSMANAYNLGLMANLSYSVAAQNMLKQRPDSDPSTVSGSVEEFFFRQCLDLSRTPEMIDPKGTRLPALVVDVPFDQRYTTAVMLDSLTAEVPPDEPDIPWHIIENTQLFYFINQTQVVVAWRGTQEPMDWVTDVMYRPMPADGSGCDVKSSCTPLTDVGSAHYGFLQSFEVAKKLFPKDFDDIQEALEGRKLFICGHSLGGALALIHSAELKDLNPLLYTYGMPRTFTAKALERLKSVMHFRHVNDADTITSVPPEAELDNWLYSAFGPLGPSLGYIWSVGELAAGKLIRFGDPYWHHGQIAMFYRADQHVESRGSNYPAYRSKEGLGAPYHTTILTRLPHRTRIYLVPSLNDEFSRFASEDQKTLIRSLNRESLVRFFPSHTNPERSTSRSSPWDHSMIQAYLPFLHNQLLELSDPERPLQRKEDRAKFEEQLYRQGIPEEEKHRNEQFLALQKLLPMALHTTRELEGGTEALQRFCREREFGVMIEITQA